MQLLQNLVSSEIVDVICIDTFLNTLHSITETPRDTREVSRARLSKHMFAPGTISTLDSYKQLSPIVLMSLFDSGNLIYSFINQSAIDRYPQLKFLIKPMSNVNVTLGDGKTHSSCNQCIYTDIVFNNVQGKNYTMEKVMLVIMPKLLHLTTTLQSLSMLYLNNHGKFILNWKEIQSYLINLENY
jgi:hypothetical protein